MLEVECQQAVGKWVNDKGIPEVGKLIQISNLFGVSMDYLLKEDYEEKKSAEEKAIGNSGYYVSREMLDGYLAYSRQSVRRITGGISLLLLSNVFDCFAQGGMILSVFYWLTVIMGIVMILWCFLQTKQYQEIKNERLLFDDTVFGAFQKQRESRRKKYAVMVIAGVVILMASSEIERILLIYAGQTVCNVFGWAADTVWLALILWAGMSMHIDSLVIKNAEHTPKGGSMSRYRWVYMALPFTALAVLIGMLTNAWSPYAPIIILFCCLLVTTCKLLIESREER